MCVLFLVFFINRNYVDQGTAQALNLTYASDDTFILRADDTSVLDPWGPGRNSVRIQSWASYNQHVVVWVVIDLCLLEVV
jgi:hypothetical protein